MLLCLYQSLKLHANTTLNVFINVTFLRIFNGVVFNQLLIVIFINLYLLIYLTRKTVMLPSKSIFSQLF